MALENLARDPPRSSPSSLRAALPPPSGANADLSSFGTCREGHLTRIEVRKCVRWFWMLRARPFVKTTDVPDRDPARRGGHPSESLRSVSDRPPHH